MPGFVWLRPHGSAGMFLNYWTSLESGLNAVIGV
jgi:hypothetical protein